MKDFLSTEMPDDRPLYIRINPIDSGLTLKDLDAVVSPNINGFVYPMSSSAKDMIAFGAQLSLKETELGLFIGFSHNKPLNISGKIKNAIFSKSISFAGSICAGFTKRLLAY